MINITGTWINTNDKKSNIIIKKDIINLKIYGEKHSSKFTTENYFDNNIKIISNLPYEYLLYSKEKINNEEIEIISGIIMEYDGRGPIVINEFIRKENKSKIQKEFKSKVYHSHNDREPIKTYMSE